MVRGCQEEELGVGRLGGSEWLIIILLVVLLFGAKRMPDAARGLGRSLRIFKAETRGLVEDGREPSPEVAGAAAQPTPTAGTQPAADAQQRTDPAPQA
jgi:sec-independent protein translocase protein TatA